MAARDHRLRRMPPTCHSTIQSVHLALPRGRLSPSAPPCQRVSCSIKLTSKPPLAELLPAALPRAEQRWSRGVGGRAAVSCGLQLSLDAGFGIGRHGERGAPAHRWIVGLKGRRPVVYEILHRQTADGVCAIVDMPWGVRQVRLGARCARIRSHDSLVEASHPTWIRSVDRGAAVRKELGGTRGLQRAEKGVGVTSRVHNLVDGAQAPRAIVQRVRRAISEVERRVPCDGEDRPRSKLGRRARSSSLHLPAQTRRRRH